MLFIDTRLPKLCHANPGDVIRIGDKDGIIQSDIYLVCAFNQEGKRAARKTISNGLYDDERPLFMVNLITGEAKPLPHLSSRVEIVKDIAIVRGYVQGVTL